MFSARVIVANSEVLVVGVCGNLEGTANKDFPLRTPDDWETGDASFVSSCNSYQSYNTHAQICYVGNILNSSDARCELSIIPYIKSEINRERNCPFAPEIMHPSRDNLVSGLINSNHYLGINIEC